MKLGYLFAATPEECLVFCAETGDAVSGVCSVRIETTAQGHRLILELSDFIMLAKGAETVVKQPPAHSLKPSKN